MQHKEQELKTVGIMIEIYCRHHHAANIPAGNNLCASCRELYSYARQRTLKCPFGEEKPVCAKCRVHCYKPQMQEDIRKVMRFSGPKMITSHPLLAIGHLMAARREAPEKKKPE